MFKLFPSVSDVVFRRNFLHVFGSTNFSTSRRAICASNCIKHFAAYWTDLYFWYPRQPVIASVISALILLSFSFDATFIRAASVSIMR